MSNKRIFPLSQLGFFSLLGMIIWPFITTVGPKLEGTFLPVVVDTKLTATVGIQDGTSMFGYSRKVRNCTFMGLEWYYSGDTQSVLVPLNIREPAKIREEGRFDFGPWDVPLTEQQVWNSSYGIALHRCHPLWITRTVFWP